MAQQNTRQSMAYNHPGGSGLLDNRPEEVGSRVLHFGRGRHNSHGKWPGEGTCAGRRSWPRKDNTKRHDLVIPIPYKSSSVTAYFELAMEASLLVMGGRAPIKVCINISRRLNRSLDTGSRAGHIWLSRWL